MDEIIEYTKHSINIKKISIIWLLLMIFIIIGLIIFSNVFNYNVYYQNTGSVIDNNKLGMIVSNDDLNKVLLNEKIIIEEKVFAYKIDKIEDNVLYDDVIYKNVILNLDINKKQNIVNNVLNIKILVKKQTIFKYILNKIGGIR